MFRSLCIAAAALSVMPSAWCASLLASHYSGSVFTLKFNSCGSTPSLSIVSNTTGCGVAPSWLEPHPEDKKLWCFDESPTGTGLIASYDVARDGRLALSSQFQSNGYSAHGTLYGKPNRKSFIATAEYVPSTITTYKFPNSSSNPVLQLEKFSMTSPGPNPRQNAPHPHEIILDPTGDFILVPDLGADLIRIFRITQSTGLLTSCGVAKTEPGEGPRHGTWWTPGLSANSTEGLRLFVLNELANSVSSWKATYENSCISLSKAQTISTFASGAAPNSLAKASEVRIFENFLYAANRADQTFGSEQDSIAAYTIDASTGNLTWIEAVNAHAYFPRTFQINRAGDLVAVGGQTSSNVAIISRNVTTGRLGKLLATVQVATPGRPNQDDGLSAVLWNE